MARASGDKFVRIMKTMKKTLLTVGILVIAISTYLYLKQSFNAPFEVVKIWGERGVDKGQFQYIEDFAFDSLGNLLVTDALNSTVSVFFT